MRADLTVERLKELLHYDPETGAFTRVQGVKGQSCGVLAGTVEDHGYASIGVDRRRYYAHRLAFLYMTGSWPRQYVDHINGNRADNRWANLRDGPRSLNQQNMRRARSDCAAGLIGAHRKRSRWTSKIKVAGRFIQLGTFATAEQASAAYINAKRKYHEGCTL